MKTLSQTKLTILLLMLGVTILFFNNSCGNKGEASASSTESTSNESSGSVDASESAMPSDPLTDKGIGPITSIEIGSLDNTLAEKGHGIFEAKCSACHKMDKRVVGPALGSITKRRSPEWIMNMILNPNEMTEKDPIAKDLLANYASQMANQNLTQDEARAILEFFRSNDK